MNKAEFETRRETQINGLLAMDPTSRRHRWAIRAGRKSGRELRKQLTEKEARRG